MQLPVNMLPSGDDYSDRVYFFCNKFICSFLLTYTIAVASINNKNRDDKYQFENHRIDTYLLSTYHYLPFIILLFIIYYLLFKNWRLQGK